ncbi:MAG TPA: rhomboid family intramembrane serine protease, partial [Myxococcaceae bacterium]|nr:rhomboid family intramembrane serine protease [Myxococcaceae bacterium]
STRAEDGRSPKSARGPSVRQALGAFLIILVPILILLPEEMKRAGSGLERDSLYFAVALVTGLSALGALWLWHRDRKRATAAAARGIEAPESSVARPHPEQDPAIPADAPAPGAVAADPVADFMRPLVAATPRTWCVNAIIALNVAVYLVMVARGVSPLSPSAGDLLRWGANFAPRTLNGQPWRLVASMFLHYGALHLLLNMFVLWQAGAVVERLYGHARFAALYLAAGVCGSVVSLIAHSRGVGAGASGAVFGVYGALGAFLLRERGAIPGKVLSRLTNVAIGFVVYNILFSLTSRSIDLAAHVGGLLGGAAAGAWLARPLADRSAAPLRPIAVVALAVALVAAVPSVLPKPPDFGATVNGFLTEGRPIVQTAHELRTQASEGKLSDAEFAGRLEERVIEPWRNARARLSAPNRWTPEEQETIDLFLRYATAQEKAWTALAAAVRDHDEKALAETKSYQDEANSAVEEINRGQR